MKRLLFVVGLVLLFAVPADAGLFRAGPVFPRLRAWVQSHGPVFPRLAARREAGWPVLFPRLRARAAHAAPIGNACAVTWTITPGVTHPALTPPATAPAVPPAGPCPSGVCPLVPKGF